MITIVDYGMGNLHSVSKALEHLGQQVNITSDPGKIENAERLILPGVGAFGDAMQELDQRGLIEPVCRQAASGRPSRSASKPRATSSSQAEACRCGHQASPVPVPVMGSTPVSKGT